MLRIFSASVQTFHLALVLFASLHPKYATVTSSHPPFPNCILFFQTSS